VTAIVGSGRAAQAKLLKTKRQILDRALAEKRLGPAATGGGVRGAPRLGTEQEVAEILGTATATLRVARSSKIGDFATLRWYKVGPFVRYDLDHLFNVWLPARARGGERAA
jgi:hypothetical protein